MVRYFWDSVMGNIVNQVMGNKENKKIENTMCEPGVGEQSGQVVRNKDTVVQNLFIMYALHIIIPSFHF